MTVMYVSCDTILGTCNELKKISLKTKDLIKEYNCMLNKLDSEWSGKEQTDFKTHVISYLQDMEQLTKVCDDYCIHLSEIAKCYCEAEKRLASDTAKFL